MSVATPYAVSLQALLSEKKLPENDIEKIKLHLTELAQSIAQNPNLKKALVSPLTSKPEKLKLLDGFAQKMNWDVITRQFLSVVARHGRLGQLELIVKEFDRLQIEAAGSVQAFVVSAEPMSESELSDLGHSFERKLGKKIEFRTTLDANVLAGVKVTVAGVTYDGTLRARLNRLKDAFTTYGAT